MKVVREKKNSERTCWETGSKDVVGVEFGLHTNTKGRRTAQGHDRMSGSATSKREGTAKKKVNNDERELNERTEERRYKGH